MRYFVVFLFIFNFNISLSQTEVNKDTLITKEKIKGVVMNDESSFPLSNVHVINTTKIKGVVSNKDGTFEIEGTVNDTIMFTYIGFETVKTVVTNDWVKRGDTKVKMTEKIYILDEITVSQYNLTGYLEVDTKLIPVNENYIANIAGLKLLYEVGEKSPSAMSRVLGSILNPVDFLYNTFSKKTKQMKKLKEMKANDDIRALLSTKFDREALASLLEISKEDIPQILEKCNYSESFIKSANDLQVLDAINGCYEEYKALKRN